MKVRIDPKATGSLLNVTLFGWVPPVYRPAALSRTTLADPIRHTGSHRVSRIYGSVKLSIKLCGQQLEEHEFWLCDMVPAIVAGGDLLRKLPALALGEASQAQLNQMYRAYKYPEERIAPARTPVPALSSQTWIFRAPEKTQQQQPSASCPVASSALDALNSVYRPRPIVVARISAADEAVVPMTVNQYSVTPPVIDERYDASGRFNTPPHKQEHRNVAKTGTLPAYCRAVTVVEDEAAMKEEPPPEVKSSATALQPATGKMKSATTGVFFDISQPPGQATIKQEPVAEGTLLKRRQLLYDKYSHRRRYWERKRCPIAGMMKRAYKRRKIKFKSGERVMLKSMLFLLSTTRPLSHM